MSRGQKNTRLHRRRFPRVSGDEPGGGLDEFTGMLFSPRERG